MLGAICACETTECRRVDIVPSLNGIGENDPAYRERLNCKTIHFVEGYHDKVTRKPQSVDLDRWQARNRQD